MSSKDVQVLTAEQFSTGLDGLKVYIDGRLLETEKKIDARLVELQAEIQVLDRKIELNATRIDMLQHFQSIGFTVLGAIVGFAALVLTLAPTILELFREKRRNRLDDEVRSLVRDELSRLNADAAR